MEAAEDRSSAAMENCRWRWCRGSPRIVSQRLVNCCGDDGAGGEAARPRILVARDDGELWAKKDNCSAAIVIVISRN